VDTDGDGIPDAVDQCPTTANVTYLGVSYCPSSLYDVLNGVVALGGVTKLSNLSVTVVDGTHVTVAILPGDPGYDSGQDSYLGSALTMDLGALAAPAVGSRINLYGAAVVGFTPFTLPDGSITFPHTLAPVATVLLSAPPPTISSITPSLASVAVGGETTLTVNTNVPVVTDTTITFTSSDPSAVTVSSSASIAVGRSSAAFTVFGLALSGDVTITASAGSTSITSHVSVTP